MSQFSYENLKEIRMSKINFVKFKNAIQLEDYLALRNILQEDVEIVFADDFYSAEFFKFLQNVWGGGDSCSL